MTENDKILHLHNLASKFGLKRAKEILSEQEGLESKDKKKSFKKKPAKKDAVKWEAN